MTQIKLSLCIIAKNEEENIRKCIESVNKIVKEIIVIDTGSRDNTVSIAKKLGAKIYFFKWNKDFAATRNYALKKAKGDWIIFLDADEYMSNESVEYVERVILEAESKKCECIINELINMNTDTSVFQSKTSVIRILKNSSNLHYIGKIHESLIKKNGIVKKMDASEVLKVFHTGYTPSIVKKKSKAERNIELLHQELNKNPNNADLYFYLIESLLLKNDFNQAYIYCDEVFRCNNGKMVGIYEKTYLHKLSIAMKKNEDDDVIRNIYDKAIVQNQDYPDFEQKMLLYYYNKKEYKKAINYLERCIEKMNIYNSSIESWVFSKVKEIYIIAGEIYEKLNLKRKAIEIWSELLRVYNDNEYILFKLISILKEEKNKEDILNILKKIINMEDPKEKLAVIRATIRTNDLELSKYIVNELQV